MTEASPPQQEEQEEMPAPEMTDSDPGPEQEEMPEPTME